MKKTEKNTIRFTDEANDDFACNSIRTRPVGSDFKYVRNGILWRVGEFLIYRIVAIPVVFLIGKIMYGLRIRNRKAVKKLKGTGYYLYGNHTQNMMDAYTPSLCSFPKRAYIVTSPDALSIKGLRSVVTMLGGIPVPDGIKGVRPFRSALSTRIGQGRAVAVYPEGHIWPWYNKIRNFPDTSFDYPVSEHVPCIAFVTTFRERRFFKKLHPHLTVTLSDPFYPDPDLPRGEARRELRDRVYSFMTDVASSPDNYEFIRYEKA